VGNGACGSTPSPPQRASMKMFRRSKKVPPAAAGTVADGRTPASSSQAAPSLNVHSPERRPSLEMALQPDRSDPVPRNAEEVQSLREQNDRLLTERLQEADEKARHRRGVEQHVQSLERQVEDLKYQLAQRERDEDVVEDGLLGGGSFACLEEPLKQASAYVPLSARSGQAGASGVSRRMILAACMLVSVETALLLGISCAYFSAIRRPAGTLYSDMKRHEALAKLPVLEEDLKQSMQQEKYWETRNMKDTEYWEARVAKEETLNKLARTPYKQITGLKAHQLPEMYGKVSEKTIWAYWYNKEQCKSSDNCTLPTVVQLCSETIRKNKGSFDFRIVHMDEVDKYVNRIELPVRWRDLLPAQQKDSLMNALLARYGGVAMDISTILLRPIDDYWEEMVSRGATFMGYMYRLNGVPWRHAETTSVWFLMSRREGIFNTAVKNQVIGMGDRRETGAYHHWYLALGDQTITPILQMFNYSLPKCTEDPTIRSPPAAPQWDQKESMCPDHEVLWNKDVCSAKNDGQVILRDPRDGPQLPFAFSQRMALWKTYDRKAFTEEMLPADLRSKGAPMQGEPCSSPAGCWQVFQDRLNAPREPGRGRLLNFVKLFAHAQELQDLSREEILSHTDSFFVSWLRLSGSL